MTVLISIPQGLIAATSAIIKGKPGTHDLVFKPTGADLVFNEQNGYVEAALRNSLRGEAEEIEGARNLSILLTGAKIPHTIRVVYYGEGLEAYPIRHFHLRYSPEGVEQYITYYENDKSPDISLLKSLVDKPQRDAIKLATLRQLINTRYNEVTPYPWLGQEQYVKAHKARLLILGETHGT